MTGSQLYIHSGTAFLAAAALAAVLAIHGWLTGAARRTILSRLFGVFYAALVISMTLLPVEIGPPGSGVELDPHWRNSINLVPFETIQLYLASDLGRIAWENLLGNLLLLVPLGALGPVAWRKLDGWKRVLAAGLAISLAIEGLQLAKWFVDVLGRTRSVDIDDVILNAAGALLGYALLRLVQPIWRRRRRRKAEAG
ncbi:MAG: VanZ family protein [Coriobacteriia bacterium]|nr:VanZ family protein [Coriobacteriia bacterium]